MSAHSRNRVRPVVRVVAGVLALVMAAFAGAIIVALVRAAWAGVRGQHFQWKGFVVAPVLLVAIWYVGRIVFSAAWTGRHRRKEASFRTSSFNTSEVRDYFINDCCFGDDLATWILDRLRSAGIETDSEPGQEDFGWYFEFTVAAGKHCCILGYQPDEPEGVWHLWLERSRGVLGSLVGGRAHGIDPSAVRAIDDILQSAPEIHDLRWEG